MWYAILFIIHLSTGQQLFSVSQLPFYSEYECHQALAKLEAQYELETVTKTGCIFIADSDGI